MKTKHYSIAQSQMIHSKRFQSSGNNLKSLPKSEALSTYEKKSLRWFIDEIILAAVLAGTTIVSFALLFEYIIRPFFKK